jgi:hypothetical protein
MEQNPSSEANWFSASQEIPVFYGTRRFITTFTSAHQLSFILSQLNPVHTPTPYFLKILLILSSHLHLGLPSGLDNSTIKT